MSRENVEVVGRMYAAFSRLSLDRDFASYVAAHYDSDCEYEPVEETGTVRGHDEMVRWHERWFEAWDEFRAEADEILEAEEVVVTGVTVHARAGKSGMEITQRFFHVFAFRDSKILRIREYLERDQTLKAAGLQD